MTLYIAGIMKKPGDSPRVFSTGSFAPTGHNEIAQGRAKRHPGYTGDLGAAPPVPPFQGLGCFGHTNPRAALRFALGYHLAPRWGIKPSGFVQ
jgi:hypothetical protein